MFGISLYLRGEKKLMQIEHPIQIEIITPIVKITYSTGKAISTLKIINETINNPENENHIRIFVIKIPRNISNIVFF
jgi:hypothetical protein